MEELLANALAQDDRVAEAKRLTLEALADYRQRLTGPRPAHSHRKFSYDQTIEQFGQLRGGALFYAYLGSGFGNGPLVELADGSVKYDMITGIGVHGLGHCHPKIVEASLDAAISDTVMQGNLQQNTDTTTLTHLIIDAANQSGSNLNHCFLTTSGAMANENALKLAWHKKYPAHRVLAFERTFMGRTSTLAQITDRAAYRQGLPQGIHVDYVPFFDPNRPEQSTRATLDRIDAHVKRYPKQHAVMSFELIQGESGYYPGDRDFFLAIIDHVKSYGMTVLIDEVQTFGRTSRLFAYQHFGLDEFVDIVTIGKISQICATLFTSEFKPKPGLISQTFTGATTSILAACVIVEELLNHDYFGGDGKIARMHRHFAERLEAIGQRHPGWVTGPFGLGGMIAFTAFDGTPEVTKKVIHALFDAGVIAFLAGDKPSRVRFLPPIGAITIADIDAVCDILESTLAGLYATVGAR